MEYLYHGTYDDSYEKILEDKTIRCDYEVLESTDIINQYLGGGRDCCNFLSSDPRSTESYAYAFKIPIDKLNKNSLYVADNKLADEIYIEYHNGRSIEELEMAITEYNESFISFDEYMKNKTEYDKNHFAEFLYFDDIAVKEEDTLEDY